MRRLPFPCDVIAAIWFLEQKLGIIIIVLALGSASIDWFNA